MKKIFKIFLFTLCLSLVAVGLIWPLYLGLALGFLGATEG